MLTHRTLGLPLHPASASLARRVVGEVLDGRAHAEVVDSAQLLVSEVVTNAIVHARSEIGLSVSVLDDTVRVEVTDHSPHLPMPRGYDSAATTGRGLELVHALATDSGVVTHADGKVVWFTLGGPGGARETSTSTGGDAIDVRLRNVPVGLYCVWNEHAAALLRESLLVHLAEDEDEQLLLADQVAVANEALAVLATGTRTLFDVRDTGPDHLDVTVPVPRALVPGFVVLRVVLERAVRMAAAGVLLAPSTQPEVVALRNWCCAEVAMQAAGLPPTVWRLAEDPTDVKPPPAWDTGAVTRSARAVVAADDTNRIIAVSPSAAELLGWTVDDLVGERLVTLVPQRLQVSHVAGFTRFLLTAERRIVGRPTDVVARRRDGSEIAVTLTIQVAPGTGIRTVFVATLEPAGT